MIFPSELRSGSPLAWCHRYSPSARLSRWTSSKDSPVCNALKNTSAVFLKSSGCTNVSHPRFKNSAKAIPLYSRNRRLMCVGSPVGERSEEHTSELQSRRDLVCRLLLE